MSPTSMFMCEVPPTRCSTRRTMPTTSVRPRFASRICRRWVRRSSAARRSVLCRATVMATPGNGFRDSVGPCHHSSCLAHFSLATSRSGERLPQLPAVYLIVSFYVHCLFFCLPVCRYDFLKLIVYISRLFPLNNFHNFVK